MSGTNPTPAAAGGAVASKQVQQKQQQPSVNPICRILFWVAAVFGWVVWVFAVAAAGDEHWGELPTGDTYGVGTGFVADACDGGGANDDFCTAHTNFAACQITAAVVCSVAVILLTVAFFRPFDAKRGSSKTLGLAGGVFMTLFAFFQIVAFLFLFKSIQEYNQMATTTAAKVGDTYSVGITAFVCGLVQSIFTLGLFRQAGHGPLLPCAQRISAPDNRGGSSSAAWV